MTAPDRSNNQPNFTLAERGPSTDDSTGALKQRLLIFGVNETKWRAVAITS